jgi:hypothetical protein
VRQLLLTTSAPRPVKARSLSGNSTLTDRSVMPPTLTVDGDDADGAAASAAEAPAWRQGGSRAKRPTAAIAASALSDRFMNGKLLFPRQATTSPTLSITLRIKPPPFQFGSYGWASPLALVQRALSVNVPEDGAATSVLHWRKP